MNSEIKFRGRNVNNNKWVYGYFGYDWDRETNLKPCIQSSLTEMSSSFSRTIVTLESVGQYTGMKDKNGTEIYKGDIISFGRGINYRVAYEDACFYLYHENGTKDIDGKPYRWGPLYRVNELKFEAEVIGNIF